MTYGRRPKPTSADPDWAELIRSELDSYVPERLPARFLPRAEAPRARHAWRPLSAAVAVFLLGFVVAILVGQGPVHVYRQATQVNRPEGASPSPLSSPTPSPDQTSKPSAAPSAPRPHRTGAPAGPAAAAPPAATPSPGATGPAPPGSQAAPRAPTPTPTPSNQGVCLLGVLCVRVVL